MLLEDFLKSVNKQIVNNIISKQKVPLCPEKEFVCFMNDTLMHMEVCVNADGEVTSRELDAVAKIFIDYVYIPKKETDQDGE